MRLKITLLILSCVCLVAPQLDAQVTVNGQSPQNWYVGDVSSAGLARPGQVLLPFHVGDGTAQPMMVPQPGMQYYIGDVSSAAGFVNPQHVPIRAFVGQQFEPVDYVQVEEGAIGPERPEDEFGPPAPGAESDYGSCNSGCTCSSCQVRRMWVSMDYLFAFTKSRALPPLLTNVANTPVNVALPANAPILFGGDRIGDGLQSGARLDFGGWLDPCETFGVGASVMVLEGDNTGFDANADVGQILSIPFTRVLDGVGNPNDGLRHATEIVALAETGSVSIRAENDVTTADAYLRSMVQRGYGYRVDLIGGYQFSRIDDSFQMTGTSSRPMNYFDFFEAKNEFHGGSLGLAGEMISGPWTLNVMGKCGVGNMNQRLTVNGGGNLVGNFVPQQGFFAQGQNTNFAGNLGIFEQSEVAYVPEAAVKLEYVLRGGVSLAVGYHFIYWSSVMLAGEQLDTTLNQRVLNGNLNPILNPANAAENRPINAFRVTDFWSQSVSLGLNWRF